MERDGVQMKTDRRGFLAGALAAAPLFVPAKAWGANDRPAYGVIGTGGRGRYVSALFQKLGAECVALCDVYQPHLDLARKDAPQARTLVDSNELLALKGVDCVLIATHHREYDWQMIADHAALTPAGKPETEKLTAPANEPPVAAVNARAAETP